MTTAFRKLPVLQTKRLILRKLLPEDADAVFKLRSDEKVNQLIHRDTATSINDADQFIEKISGGEFYYWAITLDSKLIGTICLFNLEETAKQTEIGFELLPEYRRKGYVQESFDAVRNFAFSQLHINTVIAVVNPNNKESISFIKKNNFTESDLSIDKHPSDNVFVLKKS